MMTLLGSYVRRWRRSLRHLAVAGQWRSPLEMGGHFLLGFCLSAASLGNHVQPFAMALLCAGLAGWLPLAYAAGGVLGYWLFWADHGWQGILWIATALPVCVLLAPRKQLHPLLLPAVAALIVAASGVLFQAWQGENPTIAMYLLRICLAFGSTWLVMILRVHRDTAADWVALAIGVLALAQIAPLRFLDLGILAGAVLVVAAPFPAVALAGLALDLAQITPVPMTAVLCVASLLRLLPWLPKSWQHVTPALVYVPVMALCDQMDLLPLPALILGGLVSILIPQNGRLSHRRGETGFAQVRLEIASEVLGQSEQLLAAMSTSQVDEAALVAKAADRACSGCPCRKGCKQMETARTLPENLLHRPLLHTDDLPMDCKKRGRLLLELRRSQDQYRVLRADRDRQQEYRNALVQQYHFLSEYLQELADALPSRGNGAQPRFQPEVAVCSRGREVANGDRCLWFAGTACRYYLLLCDGMGTGTAAAQEAKQAGDMLRSMLTAGYPAPYALRSFNSLIALRGKAGAVTMDLAEIRLDTGKVTVYKWGAAPSWLLLPTGAERVGNFSPPPGLSVTENQETMDKLSLRRGETLVLLSDGVAAGAVASQGAALAQESPGTLAAKILELGCQEGADDATVAVVRLTPIYGA